MDKKPTAGEPIPISTQKCLSASHDPGWNDPPKWAYSQSPTTSSSPSKRILNKRVAFPLGSAPPTSSFDPNQPLNPPPANLPPPPLIARRWSTEPPLTTVARFTGIDKEQALTDSLNNFEEVINENEELKREGDEVRRRLNLMKTAWVEDKLGESIRQSVLELSNALRKKDVDTADKIHVSLMMDHTALCSSWIPGIRHMILAEREKHLKRKQSADDNSSPLLFPCEIGPSTQSTQ
ncbi:steroid receptor RNA activator 1-like [Diprion similis]|uniref:steroid receptor RNA activator 1-like n=1 Tax=Diprion similis TaxID=362088 RepID=UPI001EF8DD54|nr:steroid receptor RNA activator 1-like [Diprion similis]